MEKALVNEYTPKKETIPDKIESRIIKKSHVNSIKERENIIKIVTLMIVR